MFVQIDCGGNRERLSDSLKLKDIGLIVTGRVGTENIARITIQDGVTMFYNKFFKTDFGAPNPTASEIAGVAIGGRVVLKGDDVDELMLGAVNK